MAIEYEFEYRFAEYEYEKSNVMSTMKMNHKKVWLI